MSNQIAHRLLIVFVALALPLPGSAQVTQISGSVDARLSGYCRTIEANTIANGSLGDFRVKQGGSVTVTGVRQTIFVENGGIADIRGTAGLIYVAKGGKVTVQGERNVVFAERGVNVATVGKVTMTIVEALNLQLNQNGAACQ
jgi:hypothetical protein